MRLPVNMRDLSCMVISQILVVPCVSFFTSRLVGRHSSGRSGDAEKHVWLCQCRRVQSSEPVLYRQPAATMDPLCQIWRQACSWVSCLLLHGKIYRLNGKTDEFWALLTRNAIFHLSFRCPQSLLWTWKCWFSRIPPRLSVWWCVLLAFSCTPVCHVSDKRTEWCM